VEIEPNVFVAPVLKMLTLTAALQRDLRRKLDLQDLLVSRRSIAEVNHFLRKATAISILFGHLGSLESLEPKLLLLSDGDIFSRELLLQLSAAGQI
jgi:hypothetical protein